MTDIINGDLRMLGDRILLKPMEWDASKIIIAIRHGRPVRGEVVAVGPGKWETRIVTGKRDGKDFRKRYETKVFRKTEVKPGDIVELGGLNIFDGKGYIFPEVLIGTERHLLCQEEDVCVVRDDLSPSDPRAVQWTPAELARFDAEQAPPTAFNKTRAYRETA